MKSPALFFAIKRKFFTRKKKRRGTPLLPECAVRSRLNPLTCRWVSYPYASSALIKTACTIDNSREQTPLRKERGFPFNDCGENKTPPRTPQISIFYPIEKILSSVLICFYQKVFFFYFFTFAKRV